MVLLFLFLPLPFFFFFFFFFLSLPSFLPPACLCFSESHQIRRGFTFLLQDISFVFCAVITTDYCINRAIHVRKSERNWLEGKQLVNIEKCIPFFTAQDLPTKQIQPVICILMDLNCSFFLTLIIWHLVDWLIDLPPNPSSILYYQFIFSSLLLCRSLPVLTVTEVHRGLFPNRN